MVYSILFVEVARVTLGGLKYRLLSKYRASIFERVMTTTRLLQSGLNVHFFPILEVAYVQLMTSTEDLTFGFSLSLGCRLYLHLCRWFWVVTIFDRLGM